MRTTITMLMVLIFTVLGFAQNKVDELVKDYGENEITLYTTNGELIGKSVVSRNSDKLPYSIKISGNTTDSSKIAELFLSLFKDKEEEGYKLSDSYHMMKNNMNKRYIQNVISGTYGEGGINVEYTKEQYTFKASASSFIEYFNTKTGKYLKDGDSHGVNEVFDIREDTFYKFEIEMIDSSRLGGKKATKFKF